MEDFRQKLTSSLAAHEILDLSGSIHDHACVAAILKGNSLNNLEIGFIQRAISPGDNWSGQIAFPGGRREPQDVTDIDAALRETWEEIGVRLNHSSLIGRLSDIQGRKAGLLLNFFIRPFVFHIEEDFETTLQPTEVAEFFWFPVQELLNPNRHSLQKFLRDELSIELPAVNINKQVPLWGLTHLMVLNLLERLNIEKSQS